MRIRLESVKRIGRKIGLNDEKGYAVAIFLALIVVSATVIGYYAYYQFYGPKPEGYNTIYLLDSQKKAADYPEVLVANQNSTLNVYVGVVNHLGYTANYQVQVKIVKNLSTYPVNATANEVYEKTGLASGNTPWETLATVTQNQPGNYSVVFELYQQNAAGTYDFKDDYCVLKIQVIN